MSWPEVTAGVSAVQPASKESKRFGLTVGRLSVGMAWRADCADEDALRARVTGMLKSASEEIIVVRMPSGVFEVPSAIVAGGRSCVLAGTLVYWELLLTPPVSVRMPTEVHRVSGDEDATRLASVIGDAFRGYTNHFSFNPMTERESAASGYVQWACGALARRDGSAYLLGQDDVTIGAATTLRYPGLGVVEIELAAVRHEYQGRGLYRLLLDAVVSDAIASGDERVVVSTQGHNIPVQRAWARAGFVPAASLDTFHACTI